MQTSNYGISWGNPRLLKKMMRLAKMSDFNNMPSLEPKGTFIHPASTPVGNYGQPTWNQQANEYLGIQNPPTGIGRVVPDITVQQSISDGSLDDMYGGEYDVPEVTLPIKANQANVPVVTKPVPARTPAQAAVQSKMRTVAPPRSQAPSLVGDTIPMYSANPFAANFNPRAWFGNNKQQDLLSVF